MMVVMDVGHCIFWIGYVVFVLIDMGGCGGMLGLCDGLTATCM